MFFILLEDHSHILLGSRTTNSNMVQTKQPTTPALEAGQPTYPIIEQGKDRFAVAAWLDTANVPTFAICILASFGYVLLCNEVLPAIWHSEFGTMDSVNYARANA